MKKKILVGLLGILICVCLISICYAFDNNTSTENTQETLNSFNNNNPKTNNNIPSNVPKIIIKDNKEYMNTSIINK